MKQGSMPQATSERSSPERAAAAASAVPAPLVTKLSVQFEKQLERNQGGVEQEDPSIWQPAAPRLRLFSPATPRPNSATPTPTRRNSQVSTPPSSLSPTTLRPASAICCKISVPSEHDRMLATAVTSPGAAPPTTPAPSRASQILSKAQALQARTAAAAVAAAAHGPVLAFAAQTGAGMPSGPSVSVDSPPGSPLMVVRSVPRAPRPVPGGAVSAAASSSPGRAPTGVDRNCRWSMPDPILRLTFSGGSVPVTTTTMTTMTTTTMAPRRHIAAASFSDEADTAAALAARAASSDSNSPFASSCRGGAEAHQKPPDSPKHVGLGDGSGGNDGVRRMSEDFSGGGGPQSSGVAGIDAARRLLAPQPGPAGSAVGEGSGDDTGSGSETQSCRGTATGDGATALTDAGSGGGGGGGGCQSPAKFRRTSAVTTGGGTGGSGRFVTSSSVPSPFAVQSPSPAVWPWPQDAPRRASQAAEGSPVTPGFLSYFNHVSQANHSNHSNHSNHYSAPQQHLSLPLEPRSSTLGGGHIGPRASSGYGSPARPGSSASVLMTSRSITARSRPRSCSGTPAAAAANSTLGGFRAPAASSGGGFSSGGGGGGAVAAAAATVPQSAAYEILPDHHSRPAAAAAAAAAVPLGSRVSRALAGILTLGNPGTFNLRMDERIDQVLNEGSPAVKTSGPKSPPPQPPNPTVIKMLHDRHEAEAQRTVVDYAFSSGNPAVWMHQIMAESGSGTPPWAQSAKQSHQQQQQQPQALRQTAASASGSGSGSAAQSPRHNRPAQPHPPQLSPRQQARPPPHQLNHHNHHNHHNQPQQHSAGGSRVGNNAGLTAAAAANHTHTHNQQQRLPTGLGPGVPRHTSAETLHLQSMSYLASKEACRTLAADSRPAVSINLREVLFDGYGSNNNDYITASNNNNSNSAGSPTGGGSATNRFGAGVFK